MEERTYAVAELAGLIGRLLHQAFPGTVWVQGQIRNLSRAKNGHVYFDLAEPGPLGVAPAALVPVTLLSGDRAAVNEVMRAANAGRMEDGVEVRIAGRLTWFTPRGRLQLRMTGIDPTHTLGRLLQDRDRLLASLRADGLLTRNHLVPLPVMPLRIGLVTSIGSAAHADFVHELERSGLGFRVIEVDARTQGLDAGHLVATGLSAAVRIGVDVVAIVRGGGSRTDLAPFDGEVICRAIATCPVPVFTGIGHEVDRSIADEVAHTAHKTPTACAGALVELALGAIDRAERVWAGIVQRATNRVERAEDRVTEGSWRLARATHGGLSAGDRALDDAGRRLRREAERALGQADQRCANAEARARALDPALTLARGWSITRDADGRVVRSSAALRAGQELVTVLAAGSVTSTVATVHPAAEPESDPDA